MTVNLRINLQEKGRIVAIVITLVSFSFLTCYFQFRFGKLPISSLSSLAYLPNSSHPSYLSCFSIILTSAWWKKKRIWFAPAFLTILLILIQLLFVTFAFQRFTDYFFLVMFIFVIVIVAFFGERIEKVKSLSDLNEKLDKEKEKLEDANKELDAFAYSVSHDLRVPLRAIDGFSRILIEDYEDKLDEECKRLINIVRGNTMKMGQLIDDILQLSRVGRQEIKISEINMEALVKNVFGELKSSIHKNIVLEVKSLPPAYGDRILIKQILINLLSNSIKFTKPGETPVIEVGSENGIDETIYYVRDHGVGFDMKYVNKLFGLFQRLHSQEEFEGTGVGLSIVQRIIRRHGGRVWGEGKVYGGATIYFTLPK